MTLGLHSAGDLAQAQFVPGHIYVSEPQAFGCTNSEIRPNDRIWQIDPETGYASEFLELPYELCGGLGSLAFTPDGSRLRAAGFSASAIFDIGPDRTISVYLDFDDGVAFPLGRNSIHYTQHGDLYVANWGWRNVLYFPAGDPPGEPVIIADASDGVYNANGVTVAPDGVAYYGDDGGLSNYVQAIPPGSDPYVFDEYGDTDSPVTVQADSMGNIYIGLDSSDVLMYNSDQPFPPVSLSSGVFLQGKVCLALTPGESALYAASGPTVHRLDLATLELTTVAEVPVYGIDVINGMAVVPHPTGDVNLDAKIDLDDFATMAACLSGPGVAIGDECRLSDLDTDADSDLSDMSVFANGFGTNIHNCCDTGHGPGCSDEDIEQCVCDAAPLCCSLDWDAYCVQFMEAFGCTQCP